GGYGLLDRVLSHGSSVWVTSGGTFTGYTVGAPAFVNAAFTTLFPTGVDAGTRLVVVHASD
ncbi:MAG: hypothetical protein M0R75_13550, partial [Dehalococcoidia bacterium]|nr:hypothetical protein [Dehalococcoidia bacterium]